MRKRTNPHNGTEIDPLPNSRLAGYEDVNDAERLYLDPAMRTVVGGRAKYITAASLRESWLLLKGDADV
jgi:hypothetical protein